MPEIYKIAGAVIVGVSIIALVQMLYIQHLERKVKDLEAALDIVQNKPYRSLLITATAHISFLLDMVEWGGTVTENAEVTEKAKKKLNSIRQDLGGMINALNNNR
jgi:hypothetical protein